MRKRQSFLGPLILIPLLLICLASAVVYYAAHVYTPAEDREYSSPYLKKINSQFVNTSRFKIHYTRSGNGPPVILVHGAASWLYSFRNNTTALSDEFTVYTLDMPGHGYTIPLLKSSSYSTDMMSDVLLEFMNTMGIEKANIVGHSSGGAWALHFAYRNPEKVKKLVLIDSNGLDVPVTLTFRLFSYPVIGELFSKFFTTEDVKKGLENAFFDKKLVTEEMIREIEVPLTFIENRKAQYLCIRNQDWKITEEEMPQIRVPVMVIWGEDDLYLDSAMARKFKEIMPDTSVVILEKCGHSAHEEKPDEVNRLITEFFGAETF
ncbi:MAG: alpha/beta hydrolase [Thermodesulfobacteriota bacterium]|nr:alpha/beta hydrolase [Thermodesulfobacteriota bacterium]